MYTGTTGQTINVFDVISELYRTDLVPLEDIPLERSPNPSH